MKLFFRILRHFSIRGLVLISVLVTLFPFFSGFISAIEAVDELANLNRESISNQAVGTASITTLRKLLENLNIKGYAYWKNQNQLNSTEFKFAFDKVDQFLQDEIPRHWQTSEDSQSILTQLSADTRLAFDSANTQIPKPDVNKQKPLNPHGTWEDLFRPIQTRLAALEILAYQDNQLKADKIDNIAARVKHRIIVDIFVLLIATCTLLSVFIYLLHNPIKQIDHVIRALGTGNFSQPIKMNGPGDIEFLGERLEWLRVRLNDLELGKQRFVRNVSHEIKTPLASLHEGSTLLLDEIVGELNREQKEIAKILSSSADKLDKLIAELINYSQVSVRRDQAKFSNIPMKQMIISTIEDHQLQLRNKAITLNENYESISLMGIPEQLKTIVDNLLSNAIKYSPFAGEIRISLKKDGGHMLLEVEDEGPGVDPDEQTRVFEPFYQGRAARTLGVKGTGFGLAIVAECVINHHGKVDVTHSRDGEGGACFRVRLPLQPSHRF